MTLHLVFALLTIATVLLPRRRAAAAGAALAAWMLGAAAFAVVPGLVAIAPLAERLRTLALGPVFVGVNVGLMLIGACGIGALGLRGYADDDTRASRAAGAAAALLACGALALLVPLLRVAGPAAAVAAVGLTLAAALLRVAAQEVGWVLQRGVSALWPARAAAARVGPSGARRARPAAAVAGAAGVAALAVPHALAVLATALVAAAAAHVAARRLGDAPALPVFPLVTLALVPFGWLLATISGPHGLVLSDLPNAPLSPPAQALLVPLLVAGAWPFLGVWPLHRWVPPPVLAPVAGALLLGIGIPGLGAGLAHLQPALFALGVVALWHAAVARRPAPALAALAFLATVSIVGGTHVAPGARAAAAVLYAAAFAVAALQLLPIPAAPASREWMRVAAGRAGAARLVAAAAAGGVYAALAAGLRSEVVLSVAAAAGVVVAAWRLREWEAPLRS